VSFRDPHLVCAMLCCRANPLNFDLTALIHGYRSVRERQGSPEGPNRPVMNVTDSPKKRKIKTVGSPVPNKRTPTNIQGPRLVEMPSKPVPSDLAPSVSASSNPEPQPTIREIYDKALEDTDGPESYSKKHAALTEWEEKNAWDREAKPRATSRSEDDQKERQAAQVIHAVREHERIVVFGNLASEALPGPETLDMGGQFLTNKDRIDHKSLLYRIAKKVPKGGLLHLHFNSELHPERLLEQARDVKNMYIRSIRPLCTEKDLEETEMVFNVMNPKDVDSDVDIFSSDYPGTASNHKLKDWIPKIWMPWKKFREEFILHFKDMYVQETEDKPNSDKPKSQCCSEPGKVPLDPAENWLKSKMVLSEKEAYALDQTVNGCVTPDPCIAV
jgi:adenosine deaminase CECR1